MAEKLLRCEGCQKPLVPFMEKAFICKNPKCALFQEPLWVKALIAH